MHTKLTIPERLKDLRVSEKRMSLQELSNATGIPSSTLGNYEKDENIDMSLGNLITLANFYNVSTDYLLCRTELRKHKNQSISDLHLIDDAVQILLQLRDKLLAVSVKRLVVQMSVGIPQASSTHNLPHIHKHVQIKLQKKQQTEHHITENSRLA